MISNTSITLAYTLAKELSDHRKPLTYHSSPVGAVRNKLNDVDIKQYINDHLNGVVDAYGLTKALENTEDTLSFGLNLDRLVDEFKTIIKAKTHYLKNTIIPVVNESADKLTQQLDRLDPKHNAKDKYTVRTYPDPEFMRFDDVTTYLSEYEGTRLKTNRKPSMMNHETLSEGKLLDIITEGFLPHTITAIQEWYGEIRVLVGSDYTEPLLKHLWLSMFTKERVDNAITFEKIDELPLYQSLTINVLLMLIARQLGKGFKNHLISHESNVRYEHIIQHWVLTTVSRLDYHYKLFKLQVRRGDVILKGDEDKYSITIVRNAYDAWMQKHSKEDLIATATVNPSTKNFEGLQSRIEASKRAWDDHLRLDTLRLKTERLKLFKVVFKELIFELIQGESWIDCCTTTPEAHRNKAKALYETFVRDLKLDDLDNIPVVVEKGITTIIFHTTDAGEVLYYMRQASGSTQDPREAATVATLANLVRYTDNLLIK